MAASIPEHLIYGPLLGFMPYEGAQLNQRAKGSLCTQKEKGMLAFISAKEELLASFNKKFDAFLATKEENFEGTDVLEKAKSFSERYLVAAFDDFGEARGVPGRSEMKKHELYFRYSYGNRVAREILFDPGKVSAFVKKIFENYDKALVALYQAVPASLRAENEDGTGQPIIPADFDSLPLEKKAAHVRLWFTANSGKDGGPLRHMVLLRGSFPDDVLHLPGEVGHCTGLEVLDLSHSRISVAPDKLASLPALRVLFPSPVGIHPHGEGIVIEGRDIAHLPEKLVIGCSIMTPEMVARYPEEIKRKYVYPFLIAASGEQANAHTLESKAEAIGKRNLHLLRQCVLKGVFERLEQRYGAEIVTHVLSEKFDRLCYHVWDIAGQPDDTRGNWGEKHLLDDYSRVFSAVGRAYFETLSEEEQNLYDYSVWKRHGKPPGDAMYGKHHRFDDLVDSFDSRPLLFGHNIRCIQAITKAKRRFFDLPHAWQRSVARTLPDGTDIACELNVLHDNMTFFTESVRSAFQNEKKYQVLSALADRFGNRLSSEMYVEMLRLRGDEGIYRERFIGFASHKRADMHRMVTSLSCGFLKSILHEYGVTTSPQAACKLVARLKDMVRGTDVRPSRNARLEALLSTLVSRLHATFPESVIEELLHSIDPYILADS